MGLNLHVYRKEDTMRHVPIWGLLMVVACGGEPGDTDDFLPVDGGEIPVEEEVIDADAGTWFEEDAQVPAEEPEPSRPGAGGLAGLMAHLGDKDAGQEPAGPEPGTDAGTDAGQQEPESVADAGADAAEPDITVGPGPGLCEPCEEESWIENFQTIYGRGDCPEVIGGSIDTTGDVICYPHDDQGTYCVLRVLYVDQCDPYPGLDKDVNSDVIVGYCRPTGRTCAEWLQSPGG